MKKLLLLVFFLPAFSAISQWEDITPMPAGEYNKITTDSDETLWMTGKNLIMHSQDLGQSWTTIPLDNIRIVELQFINDSLTHFYSYSAIYKSADSGQSFIDTITYPPGCSGVYFLNESTGFVFGYNIIYKTDDGGMTFDTVWYYTQFEYLYSAVKSMMFINDSVGFCCGWARDNIGGAHLRGFIMKTVNQGETWALAYYPPYWSGWFNDIQHLPGNVDYIYCFDDEGRIYYSTNQGETWSVNSSLYQQHFFTMKNLFMINEDSAFAVLCTSPNYLVDTMMIYEIRFSDDNFASWYIQLRDTITWQDPQFVLEPFQSMIFLNDSTGFIAGDFLLFKTTNGGGYNPYVVISEQNQKNHSDIRVYPNPTTGFTSAEIRPRPESHVPIISIFALNI
ncbi:MAG: hypothetical protein K0B08_11470 [Bacteroidales bacterium]|nr:hypothetical protein [Bacteroidales bacterium]